MQLCNFSPRVLHSLAKGRYSNPSSNFDTDVILSSYPRLNRKNNVPRTSSEISLISQSLAPQPNRQIRKMYSRRKLWTNKHHVRVNNKLKTLKKEKTIDQSERNNSGHERRNNKQKRWREERSEESLKIAALSQKWNWSWRNWFWEKKRKKNMQWTNQTVSVNRDIQQISIFKLHTKIERSDGRKQKQKKGVSYIVKTTDSTGTMRWDTQKGSKGKERKNIVGRVEKQVSDMFLTTSVIIFWWTEDVCRTKAPCRRIERRREALTTPRRRAGTM